MDTGNGSPPETAVEILGATKTYGEKSVLNGLRLSVQRGEVLGLLGPNGAGKTTLVECVVGLRRLNSGTIRVLGMDPVEESLRFKERVALQPQAASLFPTLTVEEVFRLFASFYPEPVSVKSMVARLGLEASATTRVKNLSGGQFRRALIGTALLGRPEVVFLDEPSTGLDPRARQQLGEIVSSLQEEGVTVILTTHNLEEAQGWCDRLAILVDGQIVAEGAPEELSRQAKSVGKVSFIVESERDLELIRGEDLVQEVSTRRSAKGILVTVQTLDPDALVRKITWNRELKAKEFSIDRGSLETFYLSATEGA